MTRYFLVLAIAMTIQYSHALAQEKAVSGAVRDVDKNPLPRITVTSKNGKSVLTDEEGKFLITLNQSEKNLQFSGIGYKTKEVPVTAGFLNVILETDVKQLGEVVVTALGITRQKKSLGYAVQDVGNDELEARATNAVSAISGKIAGLQVTSSGGNLGGSSRILLRGIRSLTGNNQPLFIIDGTPIDNGDFSTANAAGGSAGKDYGNMIQDLNADDIENISVLKGPSAAALYGTRAANGVILITTKKGKIDQTPKISVNTGIEIEKVTRLPRRQKTYGGGFKDSFTKVTIEGTEYNIPEYEVDESWGPKLDGTRVLHWYNLDPERPDLYLKPEPWSYPDHDIYSYFQTGLTNTNNISVSGGTPLSTYRLSVTNRNAKGTSPNSSLYRNTINFSGSTKVGRLNFFNNFTYTKNNITGKPWSGATNRGIMLEAFQWGQVQVDYQKLKNYKRADGTQILWNRSGWQNTPAAEAARFIDNPYWSANMSYLEEKRDRFFGNVGVSYNPTSWLTLTGRVNADYYDYQYQDRIAIYSRSQSQYEENTNIFREFNYEFLAAGKNKWNELSLNTTLGGNILSQQRSLANFITQGGLIIPEYYNLKNAANILPNSRTFRKRINSLFAGASVGWREFLFLDGTIRNDWSSTLPAGGNSFLYPSVAGSFVFTQLQPFRNLDWLTFGKARLGWAQVGNDTDPYQLQKVYEAQPSFNGLPAYGLPPTLNNTQLKPEITGSVEAGIHLSMFADRLGIDFTYYNTNSRNQVLNIPVSSAFGYDSKFINAGKINNRGFEFVINAAPVQRNRFNWNLSLNVSRNKNKVVELAPGVNTFIISNVLVSLVAAEGQPYGQLLGYDFVYDNDEQKVVQPNGTYLRTQQMVPLGSVLPDYLFGFENRFRYKNVDLGFLLDGRIGGHFFSQTYKVSMYAGIHPSTAANSIRENGAVLDGVQADVTFHADGTYEVKNGKRNDVRISGQTWSRDKYSGPTTQVIFDATFIKLREITLGYNIGVKNSVVKNIRAGLYGRNLVNIFTKSKDIDPEFTNSGGNIQGIEGGNIPIPTTIGLNLNINF